ncbi:MAG: hypothetical protein ABGX25_05840 [Nautiliaceae bacterium]
MFDILKKACENFAESLGGELKECNEQDIHGLVSKIEISGDVNYEVFLVLPKKKLDMVSEIFFGDTEYDEKDLTDEITNLIIGNSKVVAEEKNIKYNISIPEFLGDYDNLKIEYDEMLCFKFNGINFYILLKEK